MMVITNKQLFEQNTNKTNELKEKKENAKNV